MSTKQEKAVRRAVDRELSARGYDDYPADPSIWEETLDDVTAAVLRAIGKDDDASND